LALTLKLASAAPGVVITDAELDMVETQPQQIETVSGRSVIHRSKTMFSVGADRPSRGAAGLGAGKGEEREKKLAAWLLPVNTIKCVPHE
jgi:hypothetical protein